MVIDKSLVEPIFRGEPLNRRDPVSVGFNGQDEAAPHGFAVQEDGAGTAVSAFTPDFWAFHAEPFAQNIEQHIARLDFDSPLFFVQNDRDHLFHRVIP